MTETLIYLHTHVADYLQKLGNQKSLIAFLRRLKSEPETLGSYRFPDPRGRTIEVKIIGRYAMLFFKDPYANVIKIIDLRNVESL